MEVTGPAPTHNRSTRVLVTVIGLLVVVFIVIVLNILSARFSARFDVTRTGALKPSDQTRAILASLSGESEVILAANLVAPGRDRAAMSRVLDMIDELDKSSADVRTTIINTGTPAGIEQYQALIDRLSSERAEETRASVDVARSAMGALERLAQQMQGWAEPVQALAKEHAPNRSGESPWRGELSQQAAYLRVAANDVERVRQFADQHLSQSLGETAVPNVSAARDLISEAHSRLTQIVTSQLEDLLIRAQDPNLSTEGSASANSLALVMQTALDETAIVVDAFTSSPLPVLSRVAAALASAEAVLVIGPTGEDITAIRIEDLIPAAAPGQARIDAGRRAETLIGSALAVTSGASPETTVVLIHGTDTLILSKQSQMAKLLDAMALRGIKWIEWPVSISPERPAEVALAANEPGTVYVVVGMSMTTSGGPERAIRVGAVLGELIESGENVLVSLSPSTMQGMGEDDPMATPLEVFGLTADTGRPTLLDRPIGDRRFVEWEQQIVPAESGHPLADVIEGLTTRLVWPIAIDRSSEIGSAWPLIRTSDANVWREAEWAGYWTERDTNRHNIANPPAPGGPRDDAVEDGAFAWAVEREHNSATQRAVVVGSHLWLFDYYARRTTQVGGSVVETSPGNTELALAAVKWLAGRDSTIARSAESESFPIIQPLSEARLSAARWFFMGGLPLLVLIVGAVVRLVGG
ncbi:MAG: hypothetical protein ED559_09705 [Phycisphaera sp.]|nr:MAG: hypothetical protein ED559_09705 [Phycisphaera sp.]